MSSPAVNSHGVRTGRRGSGGLRAGYERPMQLTGTPFFALTVILVLISIAVAVALWGRKVRGPKPVQYLVRLIVILFCQATAVTMVFVMEH